MVKQLNPITFFDPLEGPRPENYTDFRGVHPSTESPVEGAPEQSGGEEGEDEEEDDGGLIDAPSVSVEDSESSPSLVDITNGSVNKIELPAKP